MYEDEDDESLVFDEDDTEETTVTPPIEFGIDFSTGLLTGGKVTGAKAVAVWVWNALKYPRYRFEMSTWQYGNDLEDLIGLALSEDEAAMRAEAIVRDALEPNEYIEDIADFECTLDEDQLTVSFTLQTIFGEEELDVTI